MATGPVETDTFVASPSKPAVSKWKSFTTFLYNSKDGTVLGRTGKSWLQIFIFYVIFYGVLAAFFAVLLVLFLQTLDPNQPKWKGADGIIGNVPGLGFRPAPAESGSTLIWVKPSGANAPDANVQRLISSLNASLAEYEPGKQNTENYINCKDQRGVRDPAEKKVCQFSIKDNLGPCTVENNFGYTSGQPCVLVKLNRIFGWTPEPYTAEDVQSPNYPKELNGQLPPPGVVLVTCNGEDNVDKEHIGPVKYYPQGLGYQYYPYTNAPGYLSPLVMVQFLNPAPGVVINVECKAWAKNIKHSRVDRLGQVHFEILMDR